MKTDLSFGDGFRFGCGFMSAIVIFWIVVTVLSAVLIGLAFALGVSLPTLFPR